MARPRILLADDHKEMRERIVRLLASDYEVLKAVEDGQAFLEAVSELKPDLCILDISIPIVNGIEAAARLKKSGSTARVIFLTIHEDRDFAKEALRTGASGYVVKPRLASDLRTAIEQVLEGRTFISPTINYRFPTTSNHSKRSSKKNS